MSKPSDFNRAVARHTRDVFGGEPAVQECTNETHPGIVAILSSPDTIEPGITSIGTIGLSEFSMIGRDGRPLETRVELCAAAPTVEEVWKNVLASCVFQIKSEKITVAPGKVLPNIFLNYARDTPMPHIYLTIPFLWGDGHLRSWSKTAYGSIGCSASLFMMLSVHSFKRSAAKNLKSSCRPKASIFLIARVTRSNFKGSLVKAGLRKSFER
ncbi:suppressor of fused domain protein [Pseudomonas sp. KNUC1026]|uniref:suppressor of fused domain protein n=1 Tax=Pseudomonas sp. KNUC1026 TaxID=2893890 RepID=UPI001F3D4505|nr:suppressor of fused domain protein [Pseudomonas sp. KNUC1026]UFH50453.1 suppressor of fused domain protein [Pseudomonas sp. KNUC1026]